MKRLNSMIFTQVLMIFFAAQKDYLEKFGEKIIESYDI